MSGRIGRLGTAAVSVAALVLTGFVVGGPAIFAVGDEPVVHLVTAGDHAANSNTRAVLDQMAASAPDLALSLGDLSYGTTGAEQAWCDFVTQSVGAGFPFELLSGNHESNGINGNINDFSACLPNQLPGLVGTYGRQSYVDVPAQDPLVRIVMISPALTFPDGTYQYTVGSPRYAWTAAAIDGARAASIPWVVVAMHKPCLSLGEYACDPGPDLVNLLLSKKVDLVLTGHEHLYQRTAQLGLGAACPALAPGVVDTDCIVDGDSDLVRGAGTVFATVGTGGQSLRPVHLDDVELPYFVASSGSGTATWGFLDVRATASTLTARFVRASGGTFADAFTIGPPPAGNTPPTASFTTACTLLDCTVDASASSDPDGTVTGYAWNFGDGSTASGVTAAHHYAASGTYTVTLSVTDDGGATGSTTRSVVATAPVGSPFVADAFGRTLTSGWGNADVGGAWRTTGSVTNYSVGGGSGAIRFANPGVTLDASLPATTAATTDLTFAVQTDKAPTGGGVYVTVGARRVAGVGEYRATVRLRANGVVALGLARTAGTTETPLLAPAVVQGLTLATGEQLLVHVQAAGASPTVLRARVWKVGTAEPTTWQVATTDPTAGLQAPGAVGFNVYLSSSTTNAPVVVRLDDVVGRAP
ncbi:MAG: PKD domain-containing protein [Cellulomonadaceae bacterium]|nr:PKD domain-containing protein [Cellulomonadaceae bacterium]